MPQRNMRQRTGARRVERLETRISPRQKRVIERAARLRGTSVTDFVLHSVQAAAQTAIQEATILSLDAGDSRRFAEALLKAPAPNAAARRAARRYKSGVGK